MRILGIGRCESPIYLRGWRGDGEETEKRRRDGEEEEKGRRRGETKETKETNNEVKTK
jgi:hypothetical protein